MNGEILLLFEKDEMEIILGQLTEDLTLKASELRNLSSEDLKQVFIKVNDVLSSTTYVNSWP